MQQLSALVKAYPRVKASGVGHSWWGEQFCAGTDEHAINIVTTEMEPTLATLRGNPGAAISVDEREPSVTVAAGVSQRVLLDYLDNYRTSAAPDGWTLPAFSWFIDQTVAGAVATGSHGSSLKFGSLSSQVLRMQLMLANGTVVTLFPADGHLWRAARVSVGRLGIITSLTFRLIPNQPVQRTKREMGFWELQGQLAQLQAQYVAASKTGDGAEVWKVLQPWDETQVFWFLPSRNTWKLSYTHYAVAANSQQPPNVTALDDAHQAAGGELPLGAFWQVQNRAGSVPGAIGMEGNVWYWNTVFYQSLTINTFSANLSARASYLSQSELENKLYSSYNAYDQYELAVPMEKMGDCLKALGDEVYSTAALWQGFRSPPLIRLVAGEAAYLSPSHGGPRMYINLEDHVSAATGKPNTQFQRVIAILRSPVCSGRLHWGKAGWPQHAKCFDGATEYGDAWCHFGCAVQQLDPTAKFEGVSGVWRWRAMAKGAAPTGNGTQGGSAMGVGGATGSGLAAFAAAQQEMEFSSCCSRDGFDAARCMCAPRMNC